MKSTVQTYKFSQKTEKKVEKATDTKNWTQGATDLESRIHWAQYYSTNEIFKIFQHYIWIYKTYIAKKFNLARSHVLESSISLVLLNSKCDISREKLHNFSLKAQDFIFFFSKIIVEWETKWNFNHIFCSTA